MNIPERNFVVYTDSFGRSIVAQLLAKNSEELHITNPAVMAVVPLEGGRINMQLYPMYFREFMKNKNAESKWTVKISQITLSDVTELDVRVAAQYEQIFYTPAAEDVGQVIPAEPKAEPQPKNDMFV